MFMNVGFALELPSSNLQVCLMTLRKIEEWEVRQQAHAKLHVGFFLGCTTAGRGTRGNFQREIKPNAWLNNSNTPLRERAQFTKK